MSTKNIFLLLLIYSNLISCHLLKVYKTNNWILNIKDFGAIGDGKSDDTAAFINAFQTANQLIENNYEKHITIKLEGKTYLIFKQLRLPSNLKIFGVEETIIKTGLENEDFTLFTGPLNSNINSIEFRNIRFESNKTSYHSIVFGVKNFNTKKYSFEKIKIYNCSFIGFSNGLILEGFNNLFLQNCFFDQTSNCFTSLNNNNVVIKNNNITNARDGFIFADSKDYANNGVQIFSNQLRKITNYPIHFSDRFPPFHQNISIEKNIVEGDTIPYLNKFNGGSADQISVFGAQQVLVKKNISSGGGDMGITITRSKDVKIIKNTSSYNDRAGLAIAGGNSNVLIAKNKFYNNGQRNDNLSVNAGVNLYSNDTIFNFDITIKKNHIYDDQKKPTQIKSINTRGLNNKINEVYN